VEEVHRVVANDGSQQRKPNFKTAVGDVKALATVLAIEAESTLGRRSARVLGALALFAAVGGILVWYIAPTGAAEKQALVVTLAQILAGAALLSGLYFTWRTLQVNREGQITERFTRAIDQLGKVDDNNNKLFEIRLGGIYALERISRESEEDHWPIMEVLTAYVRQHARWRPEERDAAVDELEEDAREAPVFTDFEARKPPALAERMNRLHVSSTTRFCSFRCNTMCLWQRATYTTKVPWSCSSIISSGYLADGAPCSLET
jgi:hypothetical protein